MTSPLDLARRYTVLDASGRVHLERLMATWSLLADLSFSDLLLYVPLDQESLDGPGGSRQLQFVVLGQIRPTTSQTLYELDLVGQVVVGREVPLVLGCWQQGVLAAGEERGPLGEGTVGIQCIPVRWHGDVLAVLQRAWSQQIGRRPGQLERIYLDLFERFSAMVADGLFPFVTDDAAIEEAPRVGDGVIVLDEYARVSFASPNAVSALHRMGVVSSISESSLAALGLETGVVERAFTTRLPAIEEAEARGEVTVLLRCIPLMATGEVMGAVILVRDVSDLRRRDRLLLSKDAAIREVHHRVKNNLQTISSLLRLQARRLESPSAQEPLLEAERRVRSIALVHELLSRESGDHVPFDEIVHSLVRMAKESNVSGRPIALRVDGDAGALPTDVATPLAIALAELLQNAVEHAFNDPAAVRGAVLGGAEHAAEGAAEGAPLGAAQDAAPAWSGESCRIDLQFSRSGDDLEVEVRDNGRGLPEGFDLDNTGSLGLAIVRDLVRSQLEGQMAMSTDGGTVVRLSLPVRIKPGGRRQPRPDPGLLTPE